MSLEEAFVYTASSARLLRNSRYPTAQIENPQPQDENADGHSKGRGRGTRRKKCSKKGPS